MTLKITLKQTTWGKDIVIDSDAYEILRKHFETEDRKGLMETIEEYRAEIDNLENTLAEYRRMMPKDGVSR